MTLRQLELLMVDGVVLVAGIQEVVFERVVPQRKVQVRIQNELGFGRRGQTVLARVFVGAIGSRGSSGGIVEIAIRLRPFDKCRWRGPFGQRGAVPFANVGQLAYSIISLSSFLKTPIRWQTYHG